MIYLNHRKYHWNQGENHGEKYRKICSEIFKNIDDKHLKNNFTFIDEDWSNKTDFSDGQEFGYMYDDGGNIFVYFNDQPSGKRYHLYLQSKVPNNRRSIIRIGKAICVFCCFLFVTYPNI